MPAQALFGISVAFGLIAWGIVAAQYFWPLLRTQARGDALRPLLLLQRFPIYRPRIPGEGCRCARIASRFRGASRIWRSHCCAAGLGCAGRSAQRGRHPVGLGIQSLGHCRSSLRLLSRQCGLVLGMLQATYFIPSFIVPLLLITHVLVFLILIRRDSIAAAQ